MKIIGCAGLGWQDPVAAGRPELDQEAIEAMSEIADASPCELEISTNYVEAANLLVTGGDTGPTRQSEYRVAMWLGKHSQIGEDAVGF